MTRAVRLVEQRAARSRRCADERPLPVVGDLAPRPERTASELDRGDEVVGEHVDAAAVVPLTAPGGVEPHVGGVPHLVEPRRTVLAADELSGDRRRHGDDRAVESLGPRRRVADLDASDPASTRLDVDSGPHVEGPASTRHGASIPPSTWKNVPADRQRSHERTRAADISSSRAKNGPSKFGRTTRSRAAVPIRAQLVDGALAVVAEVDAQRSALAGRTSAAMYAKKRSLSTGPSSRDADDATNRVRRRHEPAVEHQVAATAQRHRREQVLQPELVEQRERVGVEAGEPAGAGVDPVAGAVVLAVRAAAGDASRSSTVTREATLPKPVRGGQPGRPGSDDSDMRTASSRHRREQGRR